MEIRRANFDDAAAICTVHVASIRGLCARDYSPEQIDAWAGGKEPAQYADAMAQGGTLVVAVEDGAIVGFGAIDLAGGAIKAVYVHPDAVGQGAGGALLAALEALARDAGVGELSLPSSLTAAGFYQRHGYLPGAPTAHRLSGGVEIACIPMTKRLALTPG